MYVMSVSDEVGLIADLINIGALRISPVNMNNVPLMCNSYILVKMTAFNAANLLIFFMSIERFYCTYYPFDYKQKVTIPKLFKLSFVLEAGIISHYRKIKQISYRSYGQNYHKNCFRLTSQRFVASDPIP